MTVNRMTEIRELREQAGISIKELCEELNMATGLYTVHESGKRVYTPQRQEEFYARIGHAINTITKRRAAQSQQAVTYRNRGLTVADEALKHLMLEDDDEDDEVLVYQPLTDSLFKKALQMLVNGKSVIRTATDLEINYEELSKRVGFMKPDFNHEKLLED